MDKTPPRNRLIALYTALAVVTLLALKPALDAYFDRMHIATQVERIREGFVEASIVGDPGAEARQAAARALAASNDALARCYEARLQENPGITGALEARVRNQNDMVTVQLDESGLSDPQLVECTRTALESMVELPASEVQLRIVYAPTQADAAKLEWAQALATGPVPIREAMARLSRQGRMADPKIRPQRTGEMNLDPLRGWSQLPREVPPQVRQQAAPAEGAEAAAPAEGAEEAAPAEGADEAAPVEPSPEPQPETAE